MLTIHSDSLACGETAPTTGRIRSSGQKMQCDTQSCRNSVGSTSGLTSGILHNEPQPFLDRVGAALIARGCPKTW